MQNQQQLNQQFAIKDQLQFNQDDGGFIMIAIDNQYAKARISTYAGQVLSYQPHGEPEDLLFLSDKAIYQQGKAIRGGVPICWPWFGDDLSGFGWPSHGFARNQQWQVLGSKANSEGSTTVILGLEHSQDSIAVWPYEFKLEFEITVGQQLELKLTTKNTGNEAFSFSQALHTYFKISDIKNVAVQGLDGIGYLDKVAGFSSHHQTGDVLISQEIDRIYQHAPSKVSLIDGGFIDSGFNRNITISAEGNNATVIWNPWTTAISQIADLDPQNYQDFVCVETVTSANNDVILAAGDEHTIKAVYGISR